jgi:hypothetical protein
MEVEMKQWAAFFVNLGDMMRVPIVVSVSLALMLSMAVAPPAALADRFRGGPGGRVVVTPPRSFAPHPFASRPFVSPRLFHQPFVRPAVPHRPLHGPFVPHRHFARPFVRPFFLSGPVIVYTPPPVVSYPPASYEAPISYPPAVYSAPAPPPMPSVVEYPTGRYELRGDGISTPYTWVWIPNPPPPPAEPPPAAPAPAAPPTGASDDPSPPRHSQLYRWIDPEGVVHLTDRLDAVPRQYRPVVLDRAPSLR